MIAGVKPHPLARLYRRVRHTIKRGAKRRVRDLVLNAGPHDWRTPREDLAVRYLRGDGIEIGAMHLPLRLPRGARVRYVDYVSTEELLQAYHETLGSDPPPMVETDVVDDGERLAKFADESVDFAVANHMLEHTEDPIAALGHLLRVIRPGGILFLTLPDARHTFDARRPRTTVEHLLRDHREGPEVSRREHYEEWARIIECLPEEKVSERVAEFEAQGTRHHFHVWELEDFLALLRAVDLPGRLELAQTSYHEFAVILRKTPPPHAGGSGAPEQGRAEPVTA
jgi:SAM-dependent methyltransferase